MVLDSINYLIILILNLMTDNTRHTAQILALPLVIPGVMVSVSRQATPLPMSVRHSGHRLPIFSKNKMLMAIAGISTTPASKKHLILTGSPTCHNLLPCFESQTFRPILRTIHQLQVSHLLKIHVFWHMMRGVSKMRRS